MAFDLPILFEMGVLRTITHYGRDVAIPVPVLLHPLAVAPNSIVWNVASSDDVQRTVGGATHVKAGEGPWNCTIRGTFAYSAKTLGLTSGTGIERRRRWENEVFALFSAVTKDGIAAVMRKGAIGPTSISIGNVLRQKLENFDPDRDVTYCNVYDFNAPHVHRIGKLTYSSTFNARGGGAVGVDQYQISFQAYAEPVRGGAQVDKFLAFLMDVLPVWQRVNSVISSTTTTALISAIGDLGEMGVSALAESIAAVAGQVSSATALMAGTLSAADVGLSQMLGTAGQAIADLKGIADDLAANAHAPATTVSDLDWSRDVSDPALDTFAQTQSLWELIDALAFQQVACRFYGMSNEEGRAFLEAGGTLGGRPPDIRTTVVHTTTPRDTPASIEQQYGVTWQDVVRLNRRTTDELLIPGQEVGIPRVRSWGAQEIDGLPVFGSHVGSEALGRDPQYPPIVNSDGDYATVQGTDCLLQGAHLRQYEADASAGVDDDLPEEVMLSILSERLRGIYEQDRRVSSADVSVTSDGDATVTASIVLHAIDGTDVRV